MTLGRPRLHLRSTGSTMDRALALAAGGAPHGTLVTAGEQTAGHGRFGRAWATPRGRALALSLVVREFDALLSLRAGLAVADLAGPQARVKWPNDVLLGAGKLAGILVDGRPQERWAVLGIGVNVAVDLATLPPEVAAVAATLGRSPRELEPTLAELLAALERWLAEPVEAVVAGLRARDALLGVPLRWAGGEGVGAGIGADGSLLVRRPDGRSTAIVAGEVVTTARPARVVAASFLDCINRGDVEGLGRLMSDEFELRLPGSGPVRGREACLRAWPRYAIGVQRITEQGGSVAILGHRSGSPGTLIWLAAVADGAVLSWQVIEDTAEARSRLGLRADTDVDPEIRGQARSRRD
jgi:BirA family transcriptional regulator, biotin operon repressor / biotin---[acetyl-CoA-carboxylase] ligase